MSAVYSTKPYPPQPYLRYRVTDQPFPLVFIRAWNLPQDSDALFWGLGSHCPFRPHKQLVFDRRVVDERRILASTIEAT